VLMSCLGKEVCILHLLLLLVEHMEIQVPLFYTRCMTPCVSLCRYEVQRFVRDFSQVAGSSGRHVPTRQPRTPSGFQQAQQPHANNPIGSGSSPRCWHHTSSACGPPSTSLSLGIPSFAALPRMQPRGQPWGNALRGRAAQSLQRESQRGVRTPWAYEGHRGFAAGRIRKQYNVARCKAFPSP
jgi:hypothetical protein